MTGSGDMNWQVTFQRATVTPNDFNELVESWAALATVTAHRRDVSAREQFRAQEVGAEISKRFRIRYSSEVADLNPRDRAVFDGVVHHITGVREVKRNRWLEVDVVARPDIAATEESP